MQKRILLVLLIFFCASLGADSLWNDNARSPIAKKSRYKIGDTITVIIEESLNAAQSGSTKSDKGSNVNFGMNNQSSQTSTPYSRGSSSPFKGSGADKLDFTTSGKSGYSGTGQTSRESSVKTMITATVIDVQPNGNLYILGQRQLKVNNEAEMIEVSGVINVSKISDDDTIYSTQLANAKIVVKGTGIIANQQAPGIMTKMFEWLF